jgi:AraC family transcriptional activator of pobA
MKGADIPAFSLYGEAPGGAAFGLHIETIAARSALNGWRIGAHVHRGLHQVLWIASGSVAAALGPERAEGEGPLAVVMPPGVAHGFVFSADTQGYVLTFDPRALVEGSGAGGAFADLFAAPRLVPLADEPDIARRMSALLAAVEVEMTAPDAAFSPTPLWLARAALWRLAQIVGPAAPTRGRAAFLRFAALVEARFRDGWPVSAYAEALGLSVKRLNRLTKAQAGLTAQACLHRRVLREACERLVHLDAPASAIAADLGFDDPAYFTRFFKRMTGESPRAYREERRG